jgi:hypothetical protein
MSTHLYQTYGLVKAHDFEVFAKWAYALGYQFDEFSKIHVDIPKQL